MLSRLCVVIPVQADSDCEESHSMIIFNQPVSRTGEREVAFTAGQGMLHL